MSQEVISDYKTFQAGGALGAHLRVKLSNGKLALAGATDGPVELGTTAEPALADLDYCPVLLRTAKGTRKMVAAGDFSAGVKLYAAANGRVDQDVTGSQIGLALEAAGAAGDVVEVLYFGEATQSLTLDNLTDVIITSPSNTEVLKYNGTNWVNAADAT